MLIIKNQSYREEIFVDNVGNKNHSYHIIRAIVDCDSDSWVPISRPVIACIFDSGIHGHEYPGRHKYRRTRAGVHYQFTASHA